MRRTTAGINFFRVSARNSGGKRKTNNPEGEARSKSPRSDESWEDAMEWSPETEERRAASSTLEEIVADNKVLRTSNKIQEKVFTIELDEDLCEMRRDTTLVVVDIPGLNEAGSSNKYMEYVRKNWDTYDCAIVVMDGEKGVNTEEQVSLLKFVKDKLATEKDIPVVVLCNKVDDPDHQEIALLVEEVRAKVEEVFEVNCREAALKELLDSPEDSSDHAWPAFIPISAENAFLYRAVSRLSLDDFKKLDTDVIEKFGREEVGRLRWKGMSIEDKYKVAHAALSVQSEYAKRLETTNFDKFLKVLLRCIGGKSNQARILQKQLDVAVKKLSSKDCLAQQLLGIFERSKVLKKRTDHLRGRFWSLYSDMEKEAKAQLLNNMDLKGLHFCMDQLTCYLADLNSVLHAGNADALNKEESRVLKRMKGLVSYQCGKIFERHSSWRVCDSSMMKTPLKYEWKGLSGYYKQGNSRTSYTKSNPPPPGPLDWSEVDRPSGNAEVPSSSVKKWKNDFTGEIMESERAPGLDPACWGNLSPDDWITIADSITLLVYDRNFGENFGRERNQLGELKMKVAPFLGCYYGHSNEVQKRTEYTAGDYDDAGVFKPKDSVKFDLVKQIKIPETPADSNHWGHLAWKFCLFMDSREEPEK